MVKKILSLLLIIGLGLGACLFVFGSALLKEYTDHRLKLAASYASLHDIRDAQIWYEDVRVTSFNSATWNGIGASFKRPMSITNSELLSYEFFAESISLSVMSLLFNKFKIEIEGFFIYPQRISAKKGFKGELILHQTASRMRIDAERFAVTFDLDLFDFEEGVKGLLKEIAFIVRGGHVVLPMEFEGRISFRLEDRMVQSRFSIEESNEIIEDGRAFVMNKKDLLSISKLFDENFTSAEIDLISKHPSEAPVLLRIKNEAENKAKEAAQLDQDVSEDAYRHILWSYLLTKRFGQDFAEQVTDAHEQGAKTSSSDSTKDINNNWVGRMYAVQDVKKDDILEKMKYDSAVIFDN